MAVQEALWDDALPPGQQLVVDLEGYEGPLDVLLSLAREQKVDLARLSILRLADQYLDFVVRARHRHLDLAAEYLVMAAWLAYLKSRLLLPEPEQPVEGELSAAEMAEALAARLAHLDAIRNAGSRLLGLPRLGREVHRRGAPEDFGDITHAVYDIGLYDLLKAYADHVVRNSVRTLHVEAADLWSVDDALQRLERLLGRMPDWSVLAAYLPAFEGDALKMRSAAAATFVAALELARQGRLQLRQDGGAYSPIYVKAASRLDRDDTP